MLRSVLLSQAPYCWHTPGSHLRGDRRGRGWNVGEVVRYVGTRILSEFSIKTELDIHKITHWRSLAQKDMFSCIKLNEFSTDTSAGCFNDTFFFKEGKNDIKEKLKNPCQWCLLWCNISPKCQVILHTQLQSDSPTLYIPSSCCCCCSQYSWVFSTQLVSVLSLTGSI